MVAGPVRGATGLVTEVCVYSTRQEAIEAAGMHE
jgi:hypothetical protein